MSSASTFLPPPGDRLLGDPRRRRGSTITSSLSSVGWATGRPRPAPGADPPDHAVFTDLIESLRDLFLNLVFAARRRQANAAGLCREREIFAGVPGPPPVGICRHFEVEALEVGHAMPASAELVKQEVDFGPAVREPLVYSFRPGGSYEALVHSSPISSIGRLSGRAGTGPDILNTGRGGVAEGSAARPPAGRSFRGGRFGSPPTVPEIDHEQLVQEPSLLAGRDLRLPARDHILDRRRKTPTPSRLELFEQLVERGGVPGGQRR